MIMVTKDFVLQLIMSTKDESFDSQGKVCWPSSSWFSHAQKFSWYAVSMLVTITALTKAQQLE